MKTMVRTHKNDNSDGWIRFFIEINACRLSCGSHTRLCRKRCVSLVWWKNWRREWSNRQDHGTLIEHDGFEFERWMQVKYRIDPETHLKVPYAPDGKFIHLPPRDPESGWPMVSVPWWKDPQYVIGNITKKERKLRIVNTLTSKEDILEVGCEETLEEIRDRFYEFNAHAASYTWKVRWRWKYDTYAVGFVSNMHLY